MTHAELVARAAKWLRNSRKHRVVLEGIGTDTLECPDVIGWDCAGRSSLVECKVSRADFLRDRGKPMRAHPELGMGMFRWFATPPGLIRVEELPPNWGLIEVLAKVVKVVHKGREFELSPAVHCREKRLLMSALNRATEGWGLQVFGVLSAGTGVKTQRDSPVSETPL